MEILAMTAYLVGPMVYADDCNYNVPPIPMEIDD